MSVNPYEETERLAVSGAGSREVESWALLELAKRLDRARKGQEQGQGQGQEADFSALQEAVRLNWRAWTIIQSSLLDETNPLTPELRGDLLSLCAFIDKHSTQLLSTPDSEKVQILIDINMHLGQGLRGERLSEEEQQAILQARSASTDEKTEQKPTTQKNENVGEKEGEFASSPLTTPAMTPKITPEMTPEITPAKKIAQKTEQKVVTGIAVDL